MNQTNSERKKIIDALGVLAAVLGESVVDKRLKLYSDILAVYAATDVLAAIEQAITTCKFFPKPAEIIEIIKAAQVAREKDPAVAWEELQDAMAIHDYDSDVQFDDGAIVAAVRGLGGWEGLCNLSDEEMVLQRIPARFQALYREAVRAGLHLEPGIVIGFCTRENRAKGLDMKFPQPIKRARTMAEIMAGSKPRPNLLPQPAERKALEYKPEIAAALDGKVTALAERMRLQ